VAENPRIDELRKRLEKEPQSRLFAQLAEELRKDGDFSEAIRISREGLQKHPSYPSARMTLGRALLDTGDLAGARVEFEAVLKAAPDNILASRFLGECLEGLGDLTAAVARYRTTLQMAPGDKQIQGRLQDVEARLQGGAARVGPAPVAVMAADEVFELEQSGGPATLPPQTAPPLSDRGLSFGVPDELTATDVDVEGASSAGPEAALPMPATDEPAPIPVVAASEAFEVERPYDALAAYEAPHEDVYETTLPFGARASDADTAAPPPETPAEPEIVSSTLAELYFNQGFTEKAIEVYRQLLEREPANGRARARLSELQALERHFKAEESRAAAARDPRAARREAVKRTIAGLEGLLAAIKRG
jgi:tetratricopeptide (TPR) repeat protein